MRVKAGGWLQQGGKNTVRRDVGFTLQRHKHIYEHRLERRNSDSGSKVTPPVWHAAPFSSSTWNHTLHCEQLCEAATEVVRHQTFSYILIFIILAGMIKTDVSFILLLQGWMLMDSTYESKVQVQFLNVLLSNLGSRLTHRRDDTSCCSIFFFVFLFPKTNISHNLKSQQ